MNDDTALLQRYADFGDEAAFTEVVRRKINLVYAAALRQCGGNAHLAEDITQRVFLALAVQASRVARHPVLTAWLFTTTRNLAAKARRSDERWRRRETEANAMQEFERTPEPRWDELRPVIDEALHDLPEKDRAALLLRYFEGLSLGEIGAAVNLSENAARMRVDRAIEKLRSSLVRRGITSTAAALGAALAAQPVIAAPAALTSVVSGSALSGATALGAHAGTTALHFLSTMTTTKIVGASAAVLLAVFATGAFVGQRYDRAVSPSPESRSELEQLRRENQRLTAEMTTLRHKPMAAATTSATATTTAAAAATGSAGTVKLATGFSSGNFNNPRHPSAAEIEALSGKWQILAELQKSHIAQTHVPLVDKSGNLNDAAAKLFDLTPEEHATISDAVSRARERIEALEQANATLTRNEKGDYVITVKPFPETGGQVYDELMKSFAQTLGPERNGAFVSLAADQVDQAFAQFGATARTVTISPTPDAHGHSNMVRDEQVAPNSRSNSTTNYKDRDDLLKRIGTIAKLLPADF